MSQTISEMPVAEASSDPLIETPPVDPNAAMTEFRRKLDDIATRLTGAGSFDQQNVAACLLALVQTLRGKI